MPRGEMEAPMDTIPEDEDVQPTPMEVEQVEPGAEQVEPEEEHAAFEWYPDLNPEDAKTLYMSAQKISENCRKVEQSRLLYAKDSVQS